MSLARPGSEAVMARGASISAESSRKQSTQERKKTYKTLYNEPGGSLDSVGSEPLYSYVDKMEHKQKLRLEKNRLIEAKKIAKQVSASFNIFYFC